MLVDINALSTGQRTLQICSFSCLVLYTAGTAVGLAHLELDPVVKVRAVLVTAGVPPLAGNRLRAMAGASLP